MTLKFDKNGLTIEPGNIRVFYFLPDTQEYTGWSDEYINLGVSMPDNSTQIDPGEDAIGEASIFTGSKWKRVPDHRGETVFSTTNGEVVTITELGDYPKDTTPLKPSTSYDVWNGSSWTTDKDAMHAAEVAVMQAEKQARIDQANEYMNSKQWPGKAALGRLKEDDLAQYNLWLDYLDALEAIDISTAPDITWPEKP
ncbi:hypothetical protein AT03_17890 [Hafnia alvei FB1]|uniref:Tail assembly protein n=1 Tax=Hafnia alvei FB1 TaxID=1453496 RepID=A0A097R5R5_HAFAL|nr:tail fiber assembly protein [Hafnia alvei]AIU74081.1 hypothetical protein AT03_17890 [Hafnia alvei FB1]TBL59344.1 tail fiber assembly protein [Hafnia alvei]